VAFLSISIDICGSTEAKAKLREHADNVEREAQELYEIFQNRVLWIEPIFWTLLRSSELEIERLFLIKTIGDELWYAYSLEGLEEFEIHASMAKMISVLASLHTKSSDIVAGPEEDPYDWRNIDPSKLLRIDLPQKITLDVISDALEMNAIRENYLKPHVAALLSPLEKPDEREVKVGNDDFINLCNRLGASSQVKAGGKLHSSVRSDYIGWEIDRFFRLTKEAVEGTILVGPEILAAFDSHELIATNGSYKPSPGGEWVMSEPMIRVRQSESGFTSIQNLTFARRTVPADDLKGVGSDCNIAVIYWKYQQGVALPEKNDKGCGGSS